MQQAWDNVAKLLLDMTPLLAEAGVPARQLKMPVGRPPEEIKIDQFSKAFDWLHNLQQSSDWAKLVGIKALLPQKVWDLYKSHRITNLREQVLLAEAQLAVRKAWKNKRPSFFGRTYKPKEEEDEST